MPAKGKWSAKDLLDSTIKFAGWRKAYTSSVTRRLVKVVPFIGTKSVLFHFNSRATSGKTSWDVFFFFSELEITVESQGKSFMKVTYKNEDHWIEKPSMKKTPLRVRCSCPDFRYRFAPWNEKEGAIYGGKAAKYTKKTNRPVQNPQHTPGMCKHLVNALLWLQTNGYTADKPLRNK